MGAEVKRALRLSPRRRRRNSRMGVTLHVSCMKPWPSIKSSVESLWQCVTLSSFGALSQEWSHAVTANWARKQAPRCGQALGCHLHNPRSFRSRESALSTIPAGEQVWIVTRCPRPARTPPPVERPPHRVQGWKMRDPGRAGGRRGLTLRLRPLLQCIAIIATTVATTAIQRSTARHAVEHRRKKTAGGAV